MSSLVTAEQNNANTFSAPDHIQKMERSWLKKPVTYNATFKDADLVISLNQQFMIFSPYIKKYADENKINIQINKGTCGISAGANINKEVDIAGFCCPPGRTDRLPGLSFQTMGVHPISILVNKNNPINNLSMKQVREIFSGDLVRWSAVGGSDVPILPIARLHCKKRPGHWRLILDNPDMFSPSARIVPTIEDMFSLVGSNQNSIGHEVMWLSSQHQSVKAVTVDGLNPKNLELLATHKYKIYRTLNFSYWTNPQDANPHAIKLINYIRMQVELDAEKIGTIPTVTLKKHGWIFKDGELIGTPN